MRICEQKAKDCAQPWCFQHKVKHLSLYVWCLLPFNVLCVLVILGEFKCRPPIALYKLNKISILNTHYCVAFGYIKRNFFLKLYVALEKKKTGVFCVKNSTFLQECQLTIQFYPRLTPNHTLAAHPLKKAAGN